MESRLAHAAPVLVARGLTKVYRLGEVEVHALRGIADGVRVRPRPDA